MTDDVNRMDIREFREAGFLQEVNRLFLHPRGLALEVQIGSDGTERLGGVWDYRDDPEGIGFAEAPDEAKAQRVTDELERHTVARMAMFGTWIQPTGVGLDGRHDGGPDSSGKTGDDRG